VVDVFASQPKWVKATAELLSKRCKTYVFISTISVYKDPAPGSTEDAPLIEEGDPDRFPRGPDDRVLVKVAHGDARATLALAEGAPRTFTMPATPGAAVPLRGQVPGEAPAS